MLQFSQKVVLDLEKPTNATLFDIQLLVHSGRMHSNMSWFSALVRTLTDTHTHTQVVKLSQRKCGTSQLTLSLLAIST